MLNSSYGSSQYTHQAPTADQVSSSDRGSISVPSLKSTLKAAIMGALAISNSAEAQRVSSHLRGAPGSSMRVGSERSIIKGNTALPLPILATIPQSTSEVDPVIRLNNQHLQAQQRILTVTDQPTSIGRNSEVEGNEFVEGANTIISFGCVVKNNRFAGDVNIDSNSDVINNYFGDDVEIDYSSQVTNSNMSGNVDIRNYVNIDQITADGKVDISYKVTMNNCEFKGDVEVGSSSTLNQITAEKSLDISYKVTME